MIEQMVERGCEVNNITAKIAGGASMFKGGANVLSIGKKNVEAVKFCLCELGVRIISEDTGGYFGRTMFFDLNTGKVHLKLMDKQDFKVIEKEI